MLLVDGEKMSKSLGNFKTVRAVLAIAPGEAVRLLLIRSHYRSTLDFSNAALLEAKRELDRFYRAIAAHPAAIANKQLPDCVIAPLCDDLNTPGAIAGLHQLADAALAGAAAAASDLLAAGQVLGLFNQSPEAWFDIGTDRTDIEQLVNQRVAARRAKNYAEADRLRVEIEKLGVVIEDVPGGSYVLRKK
jgi:cysteinyl-tRNA synthetase